MWVESARSSKILKVLLVSHYYKQLLLSALRGCKKIAMTDIVVDPAVNASVNSYRCARRTQRFFTFVCLRFTFIHFRRRVLSSPSHRFPADVGPLSKTDGNFVCQCEPFALSLSLSVRLSVCLSVGKRRQICSSSCILLATEDARVLSHKFSFARK